MYWYPVVSKQPSKLPDAISYYEAELLVATDECTLTGKNLSNIAGRIPGITAYRYNQLQDIEAILKTLNIELDEIRSTHFQKYNEKYHRDLKTASVIDRYISGEPDVVSYNKIINEVAWVRNQYLGIMKGLEAAHFQITNITKIKSVGLDDAMID